jgi:hypothetical protein
VWTSDSYVISQDLASDLTSEAQQIMLGKRYASMGDSALDPKTLANVDAQIKWDELAFTNDTTGQPQLKVKTTEGQPPYTLKVTTMKTENVSGGTGGAGVAVNKEETVSAKWGEKDGNYKNELALGKGVDLDLFLEEIQEKIVETAEKRAEEEKVIYGDVKFAIEFPGDYDSTGRLKVLVEEETNNDMENEKEEIDPGGNIVTQSAESDFGLIYLTNTITLSGIAGIYPANIWTSGYLPKKFKEKEAHFWTEAVSQKIDSTTWTTEITGRVLFKFRETGALTRQNIIESNVKGGGVSA